MELIKNTVNICETGARGTTRAMADGDVIVPDIKPDILKIIQVDANACITDKYMENGKVIICGRVDYKVLYIPDKENEKIKSILTSMEFRQAADGGGSQPGSAIIAAASVDRAEFSAVNSRKLRLRAIVCIDYEVCQIREREICSGVCDREVQTKMIGMNFENTVEISCHDFTIKEMLEIPPGQTSAAELLKTDVRISDTEYKTVSGKVIVKGNAGVCILYTDTGGDIKFIEMDIPFTEVFDTDGAGEETIFDIDYSLLGVMCEMQPDSDGDMRIAEVDIDICAALRGVETVEEEVLCDCFVPNMKTHCVSEKINVTETVERPSLQNTIREIIDFPSDVPKVSGVYNVMCDAVIARAEPERGKIICEGKIDAYILYLTESEENPVYSIKKEIPFSYMIECENAAKGFDIGAKAEVKHISYSLNSAGGLELRCLLEIDAKLLKKTETDNIISVETEPIEGSRGIVIYFVKKGDMLWDIAKRYSVPCEKITHYNGLEDENITAGSKLFIPSCS